MPAAVATSNMTVCSALVVGMITMQTRMSAAFAYTLSSDRLEVMYSASSTPIQSTKG